MKFSNGILFWDLSFIRAIQDWELKSPSNFMDSIYGIPLRAWGRIKFAACLLRKGVLRLVCITGFWLEVVINPSHGSLSGSLRFLLELLFFFFFFNCSFEGDVDNWYFMEAENLDLRLVFYVKNQWGISRSSSYPLSYCYETMVYGVHLVWHSFGNAEDSCWSFSMLAREV